MAETVPNPNEGWRNYTKRVSIGACKLGAHDLKKLYRLINEKQIEAGKSVVAGFWKTEQETDEQFQERCTRWKDAFVTTVQVKGFNNEVVTGHGETFLDSGLLPERLLSVEYDTSFSPKALAAVSGLGVYWMPNDRASVFLDFSRPSVFGRGMPSEPTPNNSNWFVTGQSEAWCTSLSARLEDFFCERKTSVDWLHRPNAYDGLQMLVGVPLALWGAYRIGHPVCLAVHLPSALETAVYVYGFFLCLNVFRWMFSYARWVFPKIELASERSTARRHRALWATLTVGVVACALWDAIKTLTK